MYLWDAENLPKIIFVISEYSSSYYCRSLFFFSPFRLGFLDWYQNGKYNLWFEIELLGYLNVMDNI